MLCLKAARTVDAVENDRLARTLRAAVHKSGAETIRQVRSDMGLFVYNLEA